MPKKTIIILAVMLVGMVIPIVLYCTTFRINHERNGFVRNLSGRPLRLVGTSASFTGAYRIGRYTDHVRMINLLYPGRFLFLDSALNAERTYDLRYPFTPRQHISYQAYAGDYGFSILIGNFAKLYQFGTFGVTSGARDSTGIGFPFLRSCEVGPDQFAIRCFDTGSTHQEFFGLLTISKTRQQGTIIRKLLPGFEDLESDGLLSYCPVTHEVIYTEFFNGDFIILDSALRVRDKVHTLDTIMINHTKIEKVSDTHGVRFASVSPKYIINNLSTADGSLLYIQSMIKADNQSDDTFGNNYTVDIYDVKERKYLRSIYIPKSKGGAMMDFKACGGRILVLYENAVAEYAL